jgi:hypothetical protein
MSASVCVSVVLGFDGWFVDDAIEQVEPVVHGRPHVGTPHQGEDHQARPLQHKGTNALRLPR